MLCPFCEGPLPAGARYCPTCGTMVSDLVGTGADPASAKPAPRPGAYPGTPYADPYPPTTSVAAVVSLLFGISAWCLLPLLGAILAVLAGHQARREIRESGNRLAGDGMATAGLFLGYLQLIPVIAFVLFGLVAGILVMLSQLGPM